MISIDRGAIATGLIVVIVPIGLLDVYVGAPGRRRHGFNLAEQFILIISSILVAKILAIRFIRGRRERPSSESVRPMQGMVRRYLWGWRERVRMMAGR